MRMKLNKIRLENFKGIKSFEFSPDGRDATIRAENGVGKTTIYDGFLWALFNKDSDGKADFNVRPLDEENNNIKGLVVAVEVELQVNGETHSLRKEQHEKVVKGQITGYTAICKIDEVPKKVSEYQEYIVNLCPEEMFKMLTDLTYFNGKMHWSARRKTLLDIAGKLPKPAGFEILQKNLNGRTLEQYEDVLKSQLKAHKKDRDEINPRLDELQRGLDDYAQHKSDSEPELIAKRDIAKEKVNDVIARQKALLESVKLRQKKAEQINKLQGDRIKREGQLKAEASSPKALLDERAALEQAHVDRTHELVKIQNTISVVKNAIEATGNEIAQRQLTLKSIREEYTKSDSPNCSLCGQKWPADKPKPGLVDIENRGNFVKEGIDIDKKLKAEHENNLQQLLAQEKALVEELKTAEAEKNKKVAAINEAIKNRPGPDPTQDAEWQKLTKEIVSLQGELGDPLSSQLEQIEAERGLAETLLNELNKCLAQVDNIKKTKARIVELEQQNKDLAQKIADFEKELNEIQQYKLAESKLVEVTVNDMFSHVSFRLFEFYLNGEINDKVCDAMYHGTPYADLSAGEKIFCGIDVINTLSDYYAVEVPLFIDHAESMTMPIEAESQLIKLYAQEGVKELLVEVEQALDEVSWEEQKGVA